MKKIQVKCPICDSENNINVPEELLSQKKFGIFKIEVPAGAACKSHRFIVFIDTKGIVRGYERIDVLMDISENLRYNTQKHIPLPNLGDVIKMIGLNSATHLMHAKIFNYDVALLLDSDASDIPKILNVLGKIIMPKEYRNSAREYITIQRSEYDKAKYEQFLVLDLNKNILNIPWSSKTKFEEEIIEKALEIFNPIEQLKLLQRDIRNFLNKAESAKSLLDEDKNLSKGDLLKKITKELRIPKLSKMELNLIYEFIEKRYSY
ncbi:MAG: hypothetical protein ACFFAS_19300 [Promethearchaeota archaeon]